MPEHEQGQPHAFEGELDLAQASGDAELSVEVGRAFDRIEAETTPETTERFREINEHVSELADDVFKNASRAMLGEASVAEFTDRYLNLQRMAAPAEKSLGSFLRSARHHGPVPPDAAEQSDALFMKNRPDTAAHRAAGKVKWANLGKPQGVKRPLQDHNAGAAREQEIYTSEQRVVARRLFAEFGESLWNIQHHLNHEMPNGDQKAA